MPQTTPKSHTDFSIFSWALFEMVADYMDSIVPIYCYEMAWKFVDAIFIQSNSPIAMLCSARTQTVN